MKYTTILLAFLATTIVSCSSIGGGEVETSDSTAVDSVKLDTMDNQTEVNDTIKKKGVNNLYSSKCIAYPKWKKS